MTLNGDSTVCLSELPYNSITIWAELCTVFLVKYFLMSKKININDKIENFRDLQREFDFDSWYKFTCLMGTMKKHYIYYELVKDYIF